MESRWWERAACKGSATDLFFPPPHLANVVPDEVMALCRRCTVKHACLADAMAVPAARDHGLWAGTTPAQRRALRIHNEQRAC